MSSGVHVAVEGEGGDVVRDQTAASLVARGKNSTLNSILRAVGNP